MTLPASGAIAFSDINTELGYSSTAQVSLNDSAVRTLFGQASGSVDMNTGHGKASGVTVTYYLVGGGGGTSYGSGGGGAGGYVTGSALISGTATITVGDGGASGWLDYSNGYYSARGGNSYISASGFSAQACGGGNAGSPGYSSYVTGGSGGGSQVNSCVHGLGTAGQGTDGHSTGGYRFRSGGGGGACLTDGTRTQELGGFGVLVPCAYGYSDYRNYFQFNQTTSPTVLGLKVGGGGGGFNCQISTAYAYINATFGGGQFHHAAMCGTGGGGAGGSGGGGVGRGATGVAVIKYPGCAKFTGGNIIYQNNGYTFHHFLTSGYLRPTTNPKVGGSWYLSANACYTWYAPSGVTSVSVVAIGSGAPGYNGYNIYTAVGGGGGGLGYKNNISVTPGTGYTVRVGYACPTASAGDSYFINRCTVKGGGASRVGSRYTQSTGGGYTGDGGGNGGNGGVVGYCAYSGQYNAAGPSGGGGGAGGYSGNGGNGGTYADGGTSPSAGTGFGSSGSGGGGAGGASAYAQPQSQDAVGMGGGGTGVWGQGSSGIGKPNTNSFCNYGGRWKKHGSFAVPNFGIISTCFGVYPGTGGIYGGGGAGPNDPRYRTAGGPGGGAVHIVWPGDVRQFPNLTP